MPGNPLTDQNWASEVTQQITTFVGSVRDKTTNNAIKVVRAAVWGILATVLGITVVVLILIGLTRLVQVLLSFGVSDARSVYLSYLIVGAALCAFAIVLLRKRRGTA